MDIDGYMLYDVIWHHDLQMVDLPGRGRVASWMDAFKVPTIHPTTVRCSERLVSAVRVEPSLENKTCGDRRHSIKWGYP